MPLLTQYVILLLMIDWFSGLVGYRGDALKLNLVCELTPGGELVWQSERKLQAIGSFDASVRVGRSSPSADMLAAGRQFGRCCAPVCLSIDGNPSKFLQGHNVFGPSVELLIPVVQAMVYGLPDKLRPPDYDVPRVPAVHSSRIDITTSVDLGSDRLVHEWLKTARTSTRSRHGKVKLEDESGRALVTGDTVYWGKHSRRWTLKGYCKFCELKVHHPGDLEFTRQLREYCEGHLRLELTLRGLALKPLGDELSESLVWKYMEKIEVGVVKANINPEKVSPDLTRVVQFTLSRWMAGEDVAHSLPHRTFYRHRRIILDKLGLDISLDYEKKTAERQVFDLDYLKAHEIKILPSLFQGKLFKPDSFLGEP